MLVPPGSPTVTSHISAAFGSELSIANCSKARLAKELDAINNSCFESWVTDKAEPECNGAVHATHLNKPRDIYPSVIEKNGNKDILEGHCHKVSGKLDPLVLQLQAAALSSTNPSYFFPPADNVARDAILTDSQVQQHHQLPRQSKLLQLKQEGYLIERTGDLHQEHFGPGLHAAGPGAVAGLQPAIATETKAEASCRLTASPTVIPVQLHRVASHSTIQGEGGGCSSGGGGSGGGNMHAHTWGSGATARVLAPSPSFSAPPSASTSWSRSPELERRLVEVLQCPTVSQCPTVPQCPTVSQRPTVPQCPTVPATHTAGMGWDPSAPAVLATSYAPPLVLAATDSWRDPASSMIPPSALRASEPGGVWGGVGDDSWPRSWRGASLYQLHALPKATLGVDVAAASAAASASGAAPVAAVTVGTTLDEVGPAMWVDAQEAPLLAAHRLGLPDPGHAPPDWSPPPSLRSNTSPGDIQHRLDPAGMNPQPQQPTTTSGPVSALLHLQPPLQSLIQSPRHNPLQPILQPPVQAPIQRAIQRPPLRSSTHHDGQHLHHQQERDMPAPHRSVTDATTAAGTVVAASAASYAAQSFQVAPQTQLPELNPSSTLPQQLRFRESQVGRRQTIPLSGRPSGSRSPLSSGRLRRSLPTCGGSQVRQLGVGSLHGGSCAKGAQMHLHRQQSGGNSSSDSSDSSDSISRREDCKDGERDGETQYDVESGLGAGDGVREAPQQQPSGLWDQGRGVLRALLCHLPSQLLSSSAGRLLGVWSDTRVSCSGATAPKTDCSKRGSRRLGRGGIEGAAGAGHISFSGVAGGGGGRVRAPALRQVASSATLLQLETQAQVEVEGRSPQSHSTWLSPGLWDQTLLGPRPEISSAGAHSDNGLRFPPAHLRPPPGPLELPLELPLPLHWLTAAQLEGSGLSSRDGADGARRQQRRLRQWLHQVPPADCRDLMTLLRCTTPPVVAAVQATARKGSTLACYPASSRLHTHITALAVLPPPPAPSPLPYSLTNYSDSPPAYFGLASAFSAYGPGRDFDALAVARPGSSPPAPPPKRGPFALLVTQDRPGHVMVEELPTTATAATAPTSFSSSTMPPRSHRRAESNLSRVAGSSSCTSSDASGGSSNGNRDSIGVGSRAGAAAAAAAGISDGSGKPTATATGGRCWMVPAVRGSVTAVAACPRGGSLAVGTSAGLLLVWRCFTEEQLRAVQDVREMEAVAAAAVAETTEPLWPPASGNAVGRRTRRTKPASLKFDSNASPRPLEAALEWHLCGRLGWREDVLKQAGGGGAGGDGGGDRSVTVVGYDGSGLTVFAACRGVVAGWKLSRLDQPERLPTVTTATFLLLTPDVYGYAYGYNLRGSRTDIAWYRCSSDGHDGDGDSAGNSSGGGAELRAEDGRRNRFSAKFCTTKGSHVTVASRHGSSRLGLGLGDPTAQHLASSVPVSPSFPSLLSTYPEPPTSPSLCASFAATSMSASNTTATAISYDDVELYDSPPVVLTQSQSDVSRDHVPLTQKSLASSGSPYPLPYISPYHPTVSCLAVSSSGAHLAFALYDGSVHLALHTDSPCRTVCVRLLPPGPQPMLAAAGQPFAGAAVQLAFSPDERRLLVLTLGLAAAGAKTGGSDSTCAAAATFAAGTATPGQGAGSTSRDAAEGLRYSLLCVPLTVEGGESWQYREHLQQHLQPQQGQQQHEEREHRGEQEIGGHCAAGDVVLANVGLPGGGDNGIAGGIAPMCREGRCVYVDLGNVDGDDGPWVSGQVDARPYELLESHGECGCENLDLDLADKGGSDDVYSVEAQVPGEDCRRVGMIALQAPYPPEAAGGVAAPVAALQQLGGDYSGCSACDLPTDSCGGGRSSLHCCNRWSHGGGGQCCGEVVLGGLRVPPQVSGWGPRMTSLTVSPDGSCALLLDRGDVPSSLEEAGAASRAQDPKHPPHSPHLVFVDLVTGRAQRLPLELHPHSHPLSNLHPHSQSALRSQARGSYNRQPGQEQQAQQGQPPGGDAFGTVHANHSPPLPHTYNLKGGFTQGSSELKESVCRSPCIRCRCCTGARCMALLPGGRELLVAGECGLMRWRFGT